MTLETLDRTRWSFTEALAHVEATVLAIREQETVRRPPEPPRPAYGWERAKDPKVRWKAEAREQMLVALRDGDLHAQGRFSDTRNDRFHGPDTGRAFIMHSGHHQHITPVQWREGRLLNGVLSAMFWEFIDIRMPRFMVTAIWPYFVSEAARPLAEAADTAYTTPYIELMQAAIAQFRLTAGNQEKKECLVDWLLEHEIEGEPLSRKLADAMATLIRLPAAQRGGAKRILGPDLRQAG